MIIVKCCQFPHMLASIFKYLYYCYKGISLIHLLKHVHVHWITLPRIGPAVEEDLVTGTGVVGPSNRNNIQFASISSITMYEKI